MIELHFFEGGLDVDVDEDQSTDEDDIYTGPPPPILKMYVDKITDYIHPFDVNHVFFTRSA